MKPTAAPGESGLSRRQMLHAMAWGGAALGVGGLGSGVLAGCSSGSSDGGSGAGGFAPGFPVSVPGKEGTATVPRPPTRVVSVGYLRDVDLAVALGAPLVGLVKSSNFASGLAPWQHPPGAPVLLDGRAGTPLEAIAALRPDLILGSDDYALTGDYPRLSRIAPTLSYRNGFGQDQWPDMTARAGQALGRTTEATRLVGDVQTRIARARAEHPELVGATYTVGPVLSGMIYTGTGAGTGAQGALYQGLGMTLSPAVRGLPAGRSGNAVVSREQLDVLDADVLILTFTDPSDRTRLEADPLFARIPAVRRGSYVPLPAEVALALGFATVLSLPYALDTVLPLLSAAATRR